MKQLERIPQMELQIVCGSKLLVRVPVETINQASAYWNCYRDSKGFGSSRSPQALILVDGIARGHISYNGRVWEGLEWKQGTKPLLESQYPDSASVTYRGFDRNGKDCTMTVPGGGK